MGSLNKFKVLFIVAGVTIILLIIVLVVNFISPKKGSQRIQASSAPQAGEVVENAVDVLRFKRAKYTFLPLVEKPATNSAAASPGDLKTTYGFGLAKISYLPLPNIFEGSVENAKDLVTYREAKKNIIEVLQKKGVSPCDLNIYWIRPKSVTISELTSDDLITDGCR